MKVLFINDTSASSNWGCQATSACLKYLVEKFLPGARIDFLALGKLPYRKFPFVRRWKESFYAAKSSSLDLEKVLKEFNVHPTAAWQQYDLVFFNGEGMIHGRSGHAFRLILLLDYFKRLGVRCVSVNQSVDFKDGDTKFEYLKRVYSRLDAVNVREPVSFQRLSGVEGVKLTPDAAFYTNSLPEPTGRKCSDMPDLGGNAIAVFGSSALNKRDVAVMRALCDAAYKVFDAPRFIFMNSTKTDVALSKSLLNRFDNSMVVSSDEYGFRDLCNMLQQVKICIGGRFHPTILAALQGVPTAPLVGNTHKMEGLAQLLESPVPALQCQTEMHFYEEYFVGLKGGLSGERERLFSRAQSLAADVERDYESLLTAAR